MAKSNSNVSDFVVVESHKKLYHLKGTIQIIRYLVDFSSHLTIGDKRIVVQRVDPIVTSLNNGDVFILDAGKKIFVWCGLKSNQREKRKGVHLANLVRMGRVEGRSRDTHYACR
jgi:hypothetical protein